MLPDPNEKGLYTLEMVKDWTVAERNELRYACQTDLFLLANNVCRNSRQPQLIRKVHGTICDSLIQKYPIPGYDWQTVGDGYTPLETREFRDWSPIKQRVVMSSRNTLKSVLEAVDIVQVILCNPDVRILILSGGMDLAKEILGMARSHFETNNVLGYLFLPFCENIHINAARFTSPARRDDTLRDPTIRAKTFKAAKGGIHPDYIKLDDVTNEKNQATPELVETSIQQYDDIDPLVEPGGYIDFTGTRWAVDDLPEYIKYHGLETEKMTGEKAVLYLCQPVWTVKPVNDPELLPEQRAKLQSERNERQKNNKLTPDDVNLLWPEKLDAKFLWPMYSKNPRKFACQYLLNPEGVTHGCFTRALLDQQIRPIEFCPMPHRSYVVINWDLSGVSGEGDYAVGLVGIWEDTGRLFIIDMVMKKFHSGTEMAHAIVNLYKKYNPDFHRIESANGAELLLGELRSVAALADLDQAFYPGFDPPTNEESAKTTRIMLLPGPLESDLIQFYEGIPDLELLFGQFEKFTTKKTGRKDDGPDCLAQMWEKWRNGISVKAVGYCTPSEAVVDFQSKPVSEMKPDLRAEDGRYADTEFLEGLTTPHV